MSGDLHRAPVLYQREVRLGAPPATVFALLADFPRLPEWMPMMVRVEVDNARAESPGGVGAVRVIHSGVGRPTLETVTAFERPRLLSYGASDASLRGMFVDHQGTITCEADGRGTLLRWETRARPGRSRLMHLVGERLLPWIIRRSMQNLARRFPPH